MIGLAIITYSRPGYLEQVLRSIDNVNSLDYVKVFIDYKDDYTQDELVYHCLTYGVHFIRAPKNMGVAHMKNLALKDMMKEGVEHLFLMEDDILIKDPEVFEKYISSAKNQGVEHLNFAHHGPANKDYYCVYKGFTCYPNVVGAFSYYTKNCVEKAGYFDEDYFNAYEHVDHTERISRIGLTCPFWYFADCYDSQILLEEIPGSIERSSIRQRNDWGTNVINAQRTSIKKKGYYLPPYPKPYHVFKRK